MSQTIERENIGNGSIFQHCSDVTPALHVRGGIDDVFADNHGQYKPAVHLLCEQALRQDYDIVVVYDPIEHRLHFADELTGNEPTMRNAVNELDLRLNNVSGENLMQTLLSAEVTSLQGIDSHHTILRMVEATAVHSSKPKVCLIVDDAHEYIAEDDNPNNVSRAAFEKFAERLQVHEGNHVLLLDKENALELGSDIHVCNVAQTTREDIASVFPEEISLDEHPQLLALASGTPIKAIRRAVLQSGDNGDIATLTNQLRATKESSIRAIGGGVIECKVPSDTPPLVAMHPGEEAFWEKEAQLLQTGSKAVAQGCMLIGPPGTGKSLRARYLAHAMEVPYLTLEDTGSEGLRGVKLKKYQQAFRAAMQAKPCVLFIDEIDKDFPNTERSDGSSSNDDSEVAGYVQRMLDSPDMKGVYIISGSNNPEKLNSALRRSGRFGNKMAVLAPESGEEKVMLMTAIIRSFYPDADLNESYVASITNLITEPGVTGADYHELVRRAVVSGNDDLHAAIVEQLKSMRWTTNTPESLAMTQTAIEWDTVSTWRNYQEEDREIQPDVAHVDTAAWEDALRTREGEVAEREHGLTEIESRVAAQKSVLADLKSRIQAARVELDTVLQQKREVRQSHANTVPISTNSSNEQGENVDDLIAEINGGAVGAREPLRTIPETTFEENMRRVAQMKKLNTGNATYYSVREDGIVPVAGEVIIHDPNFTELPTNLQIRSNSGMNALLDVRGSGIRYLPNTWCWGTIDISDTPCELVDPRAFAQSMKLNGTKLSGTLNLGASVTPDYSDDLNRERVLLRNLHVENTEITALSRDCDPNTVILSRDNQELMTHLDGRSIEYQTGRFDIPTIRAHTEKDQQPIGEEAIREILGAERMTGLKELQETFGKKWTKDLDVPTLPKWIVDSIAERDSHLRLRIGNMNIEDMFKSARVKRDDIWCQYSGVKITDWLEKTTQPIGCYWAETYHQLEVEELNTAVMKVTRNVAYGDAYDDTKYFQLYLRQVYGESLPDELRDAINAFYDVPDELGEYKNYEYLNKSTPPRNLKSEYVCKFLESQPLFALIRPSIPELIQDALVSHKTKILPFLDQKSEFYSYMRSGKTTGHIYSEKIYHNTSTDHALIVGMPYNGKLRFNLGNIDQCTGSGMFFSRRLTPLAENEHAESDDSAQESGLLKV